MFVYTIVFNLIQGSYVAPIVYGRALSLHPAIVLVAVPVGGAVAGILGMFLVVPGRGHRVGHVAARRGDDRG